MTKGTILVVDDAPGIVYFLQIALEHEGYRVVTAMAEQALQVARDVQPDVILLDVMMPGLDGVALGQSLRDDPATSGIPVVAISALQNLTLKMQAMKMCADDYLAKPFGLDDVLLYVEKWLRPSLGARAALALAQRTS